MTPSVPFAERWKIIMSELTGLETISIEELEEILRQNQENKETQEEE